MFYDHPMGNNYLCNNDAKIKILLFTYTEILTLTDDIHLFICKMFIAHYSQLCAQMCYNSSYIKHLNYTVYSMLKKWDKS